MNDENNQRDHELDAILESLRTVGPKEDDIDHWSTAISDELATNRLTHSRRPQRVIEWAIAASIGFFIAVAFGKMSERVNAPGDHDGRHRSSQENYSGVDATEMKLVAIHD